MGQLSIDLPRFDAMGRADFMVSPANETALALVDRYPHWPDNRLALVGSEGAGKSHLAAIWATEAGARRIDPAALQPDDAVELASHPLVLEDVDRAMGTPEADTALFHLWNACAQRHQSLLLTARTLPTEWPAVLPDLRSRVASLTPAILQEPDDALLSAVLVKQLADRQMNLKPTLLRYMLPRMERSFAAIARTVEALDTLSLRETGKVDMDLIKRVLGPDPA